MSGNRDLDISLTQLKIRFTGEVTYCAASHWWTLFPYLLSDAPQCFASNEKFVFAFVVVLHLFSIFNWLELTVFFRMLSVASWHLLFLEVIFLIKKCWFMILAVLYAVYAELRVWIIGSVVSSVLRVFSLEILKLYIAVFVVNACNSAW